jgi:hypothetical protein
MFAGAFYDSKDIPTLVFFVVSIYTLFHVLDTPNFKSIFWHAFACALLIDIRLPGLFVPIITIGFLLLNLLYLSHMRVRWRQTLQVIVLYLGCLVVLVPLFWPYLWQHPITHFLEALGDMSHFSRQAGLEMLYMGHTVLASGLPWHYIPVWIGITTPLAYLGLFFIGVCVHAKRVGTTFFVENGMQQYYEAWRMDLIMIAWFFAPIVAVIILHSIVYDGWRQMYFVYPALVYIALVGLESLLTLIKQLHPRAQRIGYCLIAFAIMANILPVALFMVRNHPYQNLYFNALVGGQENARKNFEMDYWGLTFRKGLEYIDSHDTDAVIPVYFAGGSPDNILILKPEVARRFMVMSDDHSDAAKYVLTNYRWQDYDTLPWEAEFYSVTVDGAKVMTVFKLY